jgi:CheY-like chemotaxis protein
MPEAGFVLIVADDETGKAYSNVLIGRGLRVQTALSTKEALNAVFELDKEERCPHLILCEWNLGIPDGMALWKVLRDFRSAIFPEILFVMLVETLTMTRMNEAGIEEVTLLLEKRPDLVAQNADAIVRLLDSKRRTVH